MQPPVPTKGDERHLSGMPTYGYVARTGFSLQTFLVASNRGCLSVLPVAVS
jgi:hypothetical protein